MRVVLDANVIISALISAKGAPAVIVERWLRGDVVVSRPIIEEIARVTAYEGLQKYARLRENRLEFITLLSEQAIWVQPDEALSVIQADESDNRYLECAVAGNAEAIVSGDPHLLDLEQHHSIRIVTPATFLILLETGVL
jgi:uncharacterized protein